MSAVPTLLVERVREGALLPTYSSDGAIGLDVFNAGERFELLPFARHVVSIGFAVALPPGYYGRIAPRSGLSFHYGIHVLAGVIDPDYRGEISVILINLGSHRVVIRKNARIAQFILERADRGEVKLVEELPDTERGAGGFGSTGV